MRRESWKDLYKTTAHKFSHDLQTLEKVYICTRGLFWKKYALNNFDILYLLEIKWFRKNFEGTT
jgi:hypothetical protein